MKLLSLGLAVGLLFSASSAHAFRPHERPLPPSPGQTHTAFAALGQLDASSCAAMGKIMMSPDVMKNFHEAAKAGAELRKITPVPSSRSDEQQLEFTFDKVGSPFGPPVMIPYHASFRATFFLPQDAGWQLGEVSPLKSVQ